MNATHRTGLSTTDQLMSSSFKKSHSYKQRQSHAQQTRTHSNSCVVRKREGHSRAEVGVWSHEGDSGVSPPREKVEIEYKNGAFCCSTELFCFAKTELIASNFEKFASQRGTWPIALPPLATPLHFQFIPAAYTILLRMLSCSHNWHETETFMKQLRNRSD